VIEAGFPALGVRELHRRSAPAGLPPAVLAMLHAAIQASLDDPQLVARLNDLGLTVRKMSQAEFADFVQQQVQGWAEPVRHQAQSSTDSGECAKTRTRHARCTSADPRDFWAGAIYLALAIVVIWIGRNYQQGTERADGAGVFPDCARRDPRALRQCCRSAGRSSALVKRSRRLPGGRSLWCSARWCCSGCCFRPRA
jgi:hypothetical protein